MKSGQFHLHGIVGKNAHVNVIYLSYMDSLYIVWRGLLFITHSWAVQSLNLVIFNVPTLLYCITVSKGTLATIQIFTKQTVLFLTWQSIKLRAALCCVLCALIQAISSIYPYKRRQECIEW